MKVLTKPLVKITLPIYFTKKGKQVLLGMNVYRNMHYRAKNALKQRYHAMVFEQLSGEEKLFDGKYRCVFTLYYKNSRCDLSNVCSIIDKFALDALVLSGVVKDDNVKKYIRSTYTVGAQDKENPRVEILVYKEG